MCIFLSAKVSYYLDNFSNHSNFTHIYTVWQEKNNNTTASRVIGWLILL